MHFLLFISVFVLVSCYSYELDNPNDPRNKEAHNDGSAESSSSEGVSSSAESSSSEGVISSVESSSSEGVSSSAEFSSSSVKGLDGNSSSSFSEELSSSSSEDKSSSSVYVCSQQSKILVSPGYISDKEYETVVICNQTWMAENHDNYNNIVVDGSKCYNNSDCRKYGRLYNWEAAKTICKDGWHLPTKHEWQTLIDNVGKLKVEYDVARHLMSNNDWTYGERGVDTYGFAALPGGYYNIYYYTFNDDGKQGYWWSADESDNNNNAYAFVIGSNDNGYNYNASADHIGDKKYYYSVRCLKDQK